MALGSKKRDYKTEHDSTMARLKKHDELTERLMAEGLTKEKASDKAYEMIINRSVKLEKL